MANSMLQPHCPVVALCGGCPLLELPSEQQREQKSAALRSLLAARELPCPTHRWLGVPRGEGYRNRVRFRFEHGAPHFFNPNKDEQCAVLEPSLRRCLTEFRAWAREHRSLLAACAHAELRQPDLDLRWALTVSPLPGVAELPGLGERLQTAAPVGALCWLRGVGEPPAQRFALCGEVYGYVPLSSFRQINAHVNEALLREIVGLAQRLECDTFCDLYMGAGNFSLPLLAAGLRGAGVEQDEHAVAAFVRSALEQGLDSTQFVAADAALAAQRWQGAGLLPDLVIVDPPRAGLKSALGVVAALSGRHLVVVSCSMESFARDAACLAQLGLTLVELWLADMFPHTAHVEIMARFERMR
jgi:23S rRNA (uracil1939-C5)-methyltransferase